jgi:hypothetical protein
MLVYRIHQMTLWCVPYRWPCAGEPEGGSNQGAKLFRQMQLFLEVPDNILEFRQIFRGRLDQGLVSFQHRLRPSGRSSSSGIGRACLSFFMALTCTLKSWSNPRLHSDSAFRSLRLTTDKQPSPSSPSHNEIPASVPINVESITGQLHRSTMNSRAPRWIISLAKSLRAVLSRWLSRGQKAGRAARQGFRVQPGHSEGTRRCGPSGRFPRSYTNSPAARGDCADRAVSGWRRQCPSCRSDRTVGPR